MRIATISPSKMEKARLCEARLDAQMNDDGYDEEQGEPAKTGTLAHEAAKFWYRRGPDGNWLFTDAGECFRAAMDSCNKREFQAGGKTIVNNELPHESSSVQEARTMFDMIVAHYKRDVLKVIFAERRYKGPLKNGVPVHMILDLAVDRGNGLMELIDYKTGFLACTTDDMWDKDQVLMNLLAVRCDPEFAQFRTIQFTYFWVKKGYETGPIALSEERLKDYEHWLALEYQRLLDVKEPSESLNRFCKSCGRRNVCTKYREWMTGAMGVEGLMTPEQVAALDDDTLMGRFERLKGQIKNLEELKDQLGDHIKGSLRQRNVQELEGKTYKASLRSSKHNSYSVQTVVALCQAKGKDPSAVFSIKQKEVEQLFASDPEALSQLNLTMKRGQTMASLAITQVGVKKVSKPRAAKAKAADADQPAATIQGLPGSPPIPTDAPAM